MREVLFRGKREDNDEWVYGMPCATEKSGIYAIQTLKGGIFDIIPESLGQYTELTDKNGKKIFEGDIVKCKDYLEVKPFEFQGYIDFKNGSFVIVGDFMTHYRWLDYEVEVIGNVHGNLELLEEGAEE